MATTSNYVTKTDLTNTVKRINGLLSTLQTKDNTLQTEIDANTTDIAVLKQDVIDLNALIAELEQGTGLHYKGEVTTLPTDPKDQELYHFKDVVIVTGDPAVTGWYFYDKTSTSWLNLASGGTDEDAAHYKGETTVVPTTGLSDGDMYYWNIPATSTESAIVGMKLWDDDASTWRAMGGISDDDFATVDIDFENEIIYSV